MSSLPPETRRLHEGLIRAVIMAVRAWQDWLKVRSPVDPQQPHPHQPHPQEQEPKQALQ